MKYKSKYNQEIQEEIQDLSPLLADMHKDTDEFKVPENYFEYLSASMLEQVKLGPKPDSIEFVRPKTWYAFLWQPRWVGGLAMIALLVMTVLLIRNQSNNPPPLVEISTQEMENYITNNLDDFDTDLFISEDLAEELNDIPFELDDIDQYLETVIDDIDEETLEQFL